MSRGAPKSGRLLTAQRNALVRELHDIEAVLREAYPGTTLLGDTLARKVVGELMALRKAAARMSKQLRHVYGIATQNEEPPARRKADR